MIPDRCEVLVIGGGPAGSYTASVLAREGVNVVVLEADTFPRYHIGESMLPTLRFFLRYIDAEKSFVEHGFEKKFGATYKITPDHTVYTDFAVALGKDGFSWNVVRSEMDEMLFRHSQQCGAQAFYGTKVTDIKFAPHKDEGATSELNSAKLASVGRPISARWRRQDSSGEIHFDYLVDASGRNGLVSTKYLHNRRPNEGLRNIANWAYWKGTKQYIGQKQDNSPFFEGLKDGSGWTWTIPLHNGTTSIGTVMRQDIFFAKKKNGSFASSEEFYRDNLSEAGRTSELLSEATICSDIKTASDWSYSATTYAGPYMRLVGDAGCFIDPFFASGVHLALTAALSAATTIQAARRKDCNELTAAKWHSTKVAEGYTRFLIVVMTILRQIRHPERFTLKNDSEETDDPNKAFEAMQPIIQGTADADSNENIQRRAASGVGFALQNMEQVSPERQQAILDKVRHAGDQSSEMDNLSNDEHQILQNFVFRTLSSQGNQRDLDFYTKDVIDGLVPNMTRGGLGLMSTTASTVSTNGHAS